MRDNGCMTDSPRITAGRINVTGTLACTFAEGAMDTLTRMLGLTEPPRYHVKVACPPDADRRCPACGEPADAIVIEDVALFDGGQAKKVGDGTGYWLVGLDPAAYGCEPCGHRFDRDGVEIDG